MKNGKENGPSQRSSSADEPEVHFTEADFQAIAEELGVPCTPGLKNQLTNSAKNYFSLADYWEHRESTVELRADLTKIGKQAKKLRESLENLSPLGQLVFKEESIDLERTIVDIGHLQEVAEDEVQYLKFVKRGPTKNAPLIMHIVMLAAIYHEHTGKIPGISTDYEKYVRGGPFLRFVITYLRAVAPNLVASEQDEQRIAELIKHNIDIIRSHPK
jgi:hypothetical protein